MPEATLDYSSANALIDSIREKRRMEYARRQSVENSSGDSNLSGNIRSTISTGEQSATNGADNYQRDRTERRETPSGIHGRDGSTESSTRSTNSTDTVSRPIGGVSTGSNSSNDQSGGSINFEQSTTKRGGLSSKFQPFMRAVKQVVPRQNSATQSTSRRTTATSKRGKKLTEAEAIKVRDRLIKVLIWETDHADKFIQATTRGHNPVHIWSTMSRYECEVIADWLIARGKQNEVAADVVRGMSEFLEQIQVAIIITPRLWYTGQTYLQRGFSLR